MLRRPRGFSLAEILVGLTLIGVLGAMFTRIMVTQGRFTDQMNALRGARTVSRQAMNILVSEARMVQDSGGIDSASTDGKTIRLLVPYHFGLNCGVSGASTVVSMLPVDSMTIVLAKYAGYGLRSQTGRYTIVYPLDPLGADAPAPAADPVQCTGSAAGQAQIKTITMAGHAGAVLDIKPSQPTAVKGQAVFLFQRVTYTFKTSTAFPGQFGLFRTVQGGSEEELIAPFDSSARFKYWTSGAATSVSAPPALGLIRGVDVVFVTRSGYTPQGKSAPSKATVIASIFFKNTRAY